MTRASLFRRHYFISLAVIVMGVAISVGVASVIDAIERDRTFRPPTEFFLQMLKASGLPMEQAVSQLNADGRGPMTFEYLTVESESVRGLGVDDRKLLDSGEPVTRKESLFSPPSETLVAIEPGQSYLRMRFKARGPPGGFPGGPPPTPPPGMSGDHPRPPMPPPPPRRSPLPLILVSLFLSVVVTTGIAISLLFSSYRARAKTAQTVLREIKSGNLSARMPVQKLDELGELVTSFNQMADEVESLVGRIRQAEAGRMQVLQRLAHDLRTPLASIRTFLETLRDDRSRMSEEQIQRSLELSLAEQEYFGRLVEDLLTLASLGDAVSDRDLEQVNLADLTLRVSEVFRERESGLLVDLQIDSSATQGPLVSGHRWLLERLIRNGIQNAVAFTKSRVEVELRYATPEGYRLLIRDDGSGLSEAALAEFGQMRKTRRVDSNQGLRVSLGMGSVIMKEIALRHHGSASIANRKDAQGAELTIIIQPGSVLSAR